MEETSDLKPDFSEVFSQLQLAIRNGTESDVNPLLKKITEATQLTEEQWSALILESKNSFQKLWPGSSDDNERNILIRLAQKLIELCSEKTDLCLTEKGLQDFLDILIEREFTGPKARAQCYDLCELLHADYPKYDICLGYFFRSSKYPSVSARMASITDNSPHNLNNSYQLRKSIGHGLVSMQETLVTELSSIDDDTMANLAQGFSCSLSDVLRYFHIRPNTERYQNLFYHFMFDKFIKEKKFESAWKFILWFDKCFEDNPLPMKGIKFLNAQNQSPWDTAVWVIQKSIAYLRHHCHPNEPNEEHFQYLNKNLTPLFFILVALLARGIDKTTTDPRAQCLGEFLYAKKTFSDLIQAFCGQIVSVTVRPLVFLFVDNITLGDYNFLKDVSKIGEALLFAKDSQGYTVRHQLNELLNGARNNYYSSSYISSQISFLKTELKRRGALTILCANQFSPDSVFFKSTLQPSVAKKIALYVKQGYKHPDFYESIKKGWYGFVRIRSLVESGINIHGKNEQGQTALEVFVSAFTQIISLNHNNPNKYSTYIREFPYYFLIFLYLLSKGLNIDIEKPDEKTKCFIGYAKGTNNFYALEKACAPTCDDTSLERPMLFWLVANETLNSDEVIKYCLNKDFFDPFWHGDAVEKVQEEHSDDRLKFINNEIMGVEKAISEKRAITLLCSHRFGHKEAGAGPAAFFQVPKAVMKVIAQSLVKSEQDELQRKMRVI